MPQSYTCLLYHLVFCTKNREPWLLPELRPRLWEYLSGALRGEGGFRVLANGAADHVHLLTRLRQDKALSEVLRSIKANSSGWIHDRFPKLRSFRWAGWLWCFHGEQIPSCNGSTLHRESGNPPPEALISRRIPNTAQSA